MSPLHGLTLIVSGAASGIGLATATAAVRSGAHVALLDRDAEAVHEAAARMDAAPRTLPIACDVSSKGHVDAAVGRVIAEFGTPDGLVTAAGIEKGAPSHQVSEPDWRATLDTNLTGTFLLCQAVLAARLAHTSGSTSIVCVSSPAAFTGFSAGENAAYSASKGGVSALVRSLAIEYAPHGVRVNAVVPGATETPLMWANVPEDEVAEVRRRVERSIPVGRLARPEEIAEAVLFLLTAGYMTGTHVVVDGGLLARTEIAA